MEDIAATPAIRVIPAPAAARAAMASRAAPAPPASTVAREARPGAAVLVDLAGAWEGEAMAAAAVPAAAREAEVRVRAAVAAPGAGVAAFLAIGGPVVRSATEVRTPALV